MDFTKIKIMPQGYRVELEEYYDGWTCVIIDLWERKHFISSDCDSPETAFNSAVNKANQYLENQKT